MSSHLMIDLETLGQRPGSVIASIGAVLFGDGQVHSKFYRRIDLKSCTQAGLTVDADTVAWWLRQGDQARAETFGEDEPRTTLAVALQQLSALIGPQTCVWGNGAVFDLGLLAAAYHALHLEVPWKFRNERCYRTVAALNPQVPRPAMAGVKHVAVDDAEAQARHLMLILPGL